MIRLRDVHPKLYDLLAKKIPLDSGTRSAKIFALGFGPRFFIQIWKNNRNWLIFNGVASIFEEM